MASKNINPWGYRSHVEDSAREYVHGDSCNSYSPMLNPYGKKAKARINRAPASMETRKDYEPSSMAIIMLQSLQWVKRSISDE